MKVPTMIGILQFPWILLI